MRVEQPEGKRGSLKWIQRAIELRPDSLRPSGLPAIRWLSPLRQDNFAEYRDAAFLKLIDLPHLQDALTAFWPRSGPQWDALGLIDGTPVLVEAKAHLDEFFSPASQASSDSLKKIEAALHSVADEIGARPAADWSKVFYQYSNRIAHLQFLHRHGVKAHLLFVSFLNDQDMAGPRFAAEWDTAFRVADYVLGIPKRHALRRYIHHVYPNVAELVG